MTSVEYRHIGLNRSKYKAQRSMSDGILFDSKKEAARYSQLRLMEMERKISDLKRQVRFQLAKVIDGKDYIVRTPTGRCMSYLADFSYYDNTAKRTVVEDVKGYDTPVSAIKRAIVKMFYDIDVEVV